VFVQYNDDLQPGYVYYIYISGRALVFNQKQSGRLQQEIGIRQETGIESFL